MTDVLDAEKVENRLRHGRDAQPTDAPTLPPPSAIRAAESSLAARARSHGRLGGTADADVVGHIVDDIVPALTGQAASSRYYGFVTGGVLPIAEWADNVVSRLDQNVQVHLPAQCVATAVEHAALNMLAGLLRLDGAGDDDQGEVWQGKTLTTGATASNILGLACGREAILRKRLGGGSDNCIQVLTSAGHSSVSKAASVVGIGRRHVKELARSSAQPWRLDLDAVERELQRPGVVSIVAVGVGDVNTGGFALDGVDEWRRLRALADEYGAWVHVDGAFGIFARVLGSNEEHASLKRQAQGIELADSITVDGHKILNVPYDCGMFFTHSASTLQSVFLNPNAAYLSSGSAAGIPSPLNIGLENSRRFRALPVYAALLSEGSAGFERLVSNMVQLARRLAAFLRDSPDYELLPDESAGLDRTFIIVLFRAKDRALNEVLTDKINQTRQMYVSGTVWRGSKAVRIAVSNWRVDVSRDFDVVTAILKAVAAGEEFDLGRVGA
ncbi:pyridoxal-dependent decarboxylase conserved domain-containing protein [Hirsutella rhossiliensis]|uniref:Pyridoxal-dependent decarboxylase conserved domain-containing protein n=1 Tax=Hirsutella rhossiliensis TaxID=111463 RepID=A0A9P8N0N6_9HYPO|nr:pyridoxal-dependent decarboxylase conserved domain-containing protein [Hirsutella rhossiliensis]KAH0963776.1 pyridoxal-dependent decarboxylase conserved domain-containing protein [Hirsutella rhossiliensis]